MISVKKKLLFIFGTRPEAIKLIPLIKMFEKDNNFVIKICVTSQHREMLEQILDFFDVKPNYNLNIMIPNQSLYYLTSSMLVKLEHIIESENPNLIIVQGDTTTAFVGALAGFYRKIRIAHIEAGLRSGDKYSPFPEEINRKLISHIADYHFAPTKNAKKNLYEEGIRQNVWVVGNTVIDTLYLTLDLIKEKYEKNIYEFFSFLDLSKRIILVTSHRRENFGRPLKNIIEALIELTNIFKDIQIIYPVHLNPHVRKFVFETLNNRPRIHLIEPLPYPYLVWLMSKSYLILTDSGGIQEEAPSLGKPVLVMRKVTERVEGIEAGTTKIVGTNREKIVNEAVKLLTNEEEYNKMAKMINPYGDGNASERIYTLLKSLI